jgi:hypothetical protein
MGNSERVPNAGKDKAGDVPFERLVKGQLAALQSDDHIAGVKFDSIGPGNRVNLVGIEPQGVESDEGVSRRGWGCGRSEAKTQKEETHGQAEPHTTSVVTFGMKGQGECESFLREG